MAGDEGTYFEDLEVGYEFEFGAYEVTREEIIEFDQKYDPQPFHLSDEAAAKMHFGKLCASGWHTCAMVMHMTVDYLAEHKWHGLGGRGIDKLNWKRPVYPGDVLRLKNKIIEARVSKSRPYMGLNVIEYKCLNQKDEVVMTYEATVFNLRKGYTAPDA